MDYLQYEWNSVAAKKHYFTEVLNLIINGLPSILSLWEDGLNLMYGVLNLIINGLPSILEDLNCNKYYSKVLNLIINGLPSIQY